MAKNWHDAVWRAFPSEILGRGEEPAGGKPTVVLRVDYFDGKSSRRLHGARARGVRRRSSEERRPRRLAADDVYARTEHTAGWLKLHNGGTAGRRRPRSCSPRPDPAANRRQPADRR